MAGVPWHECVSWPWLSLRIQQGFVNKSTSCDQAVLSSLPVAHLTRPSSVQQLEARQPHARLRVHVDLHSVRWFKQEQSLHLAHPTTEAAGLPSTSTCTSTHSEGSPHLVLCVTLQAYAPRQSTPTPAGSSVRVKMMLYHLNFYSAFESNPNITAAEINKKNN